MPTRDFTANVISASKVTPSGSFQDSAASGVWDINAALDLIKGGNWPVPGNLNPAAFVDGLFQTHLYDGTGSDQTITNGIDLSGEGGLLWIKNRDNTNSNWLLDSERSNFAARLISNGTNFSYSDSGAYAVPTSTGFTTKGNDANINASSYGYVSWTFRKQPKFFDVVTWTGDGTVRNISHNLGSVPGMIIVKNTSDGSTDWRVYHRGVNGGTQPYNWSLKLNDTAAQGFGGLWNTTAPTSTQFSISGDTDTNKSGDTYVAYLFAHNNNDGGFGEPGNQDIIKCGSYTGNGTVGNSITLGFEPQWIMIKNTNRGEAWYMYDVMRGIATDGNDKIIYANATDSELDASDSIDVTSTGFSIKRGNQFFINYTGDEYIYMAIRRGGMQTPTSASDVFAISTFGQGGSSAPAYTSNFPVDMYFERPINTSFHTAISSRLTAPKYMKTNATDAEVADSGLKYDFMDGVYNSTGTLTNYYAWMWKRARGFFDVVAYTGDGTTNRSISHNLGVAPQLMIHKRRDSTNDWYVPDFINSKILILNATAAAYDTSILANYYGSGNGSSGGAGSLVTPDASTFTVTPNINVNASGGTYVVYLFATLAGVSKVGSYTGDGTTGRVIDCGFTSGAKFVVIKPTSQTGSWIVYDTARGIVAGNDPFLQLNNTPAEVTNQSDDIDPDNSGFIVNQATGNYLNQSGVDYIFYAVAT